MSAEYLSVVIETLSHDGRGIFHIQGKITFIQGALPGEEVTYKLIKQKSTYNEAQALEILKPSSARCRAFMQTFRRLRRLQPTIYPCKFTSFLQTKYFTRITQPARQN